MNCVRFLAYIILIFGFQTATSQGYFQQEVNYSIKVKLNDKNHSLSAFETIEYINNSPDTLTYIYFHLWPNAYKNQNTALAKQLLESGETKMHFASEDELGFIDSLAFLVNEKKANWELDKNNIDICKIFLPEPLLPKGKINISTPFFVKLPSALISRLGHIDQAYMITQWYPKPAVYDKEGWHAIPYLNQGEFFSEYGSFEVDITLPENYVIQATGNIINGEKEYAWLEQRAAETELKIDNFNKGNFKVNMSFPPSSETQKTLKFKQKNVHDFAWFCDKRFNVIKSQVTLPESEKKVDTWALFTDKNLEYWRYASAYLNDATFFYSLWNGDYPYEHVTAVDGTISAGGGMEYPNITVIGDVNSDFSLETVIMHEVGHNWFYGILGTNERENAWMDEGINSFNELRYIRTKYPNYTLGQLLGIDTTLKLGGINNFKQKSQYELLYKYQAKQGVDQPCQLHAAKFTETNYGAIVYSKTAILFDYLMHYMGEDDFDKAMKFYFDNWKFKHPCPNDLRKTLEYFSEKDLSWFFEDLIKTTKKLDYKIKSVKKGADGTYQITIKNKGKIAGPVALCALKNNKIKVLSWFDGFTSERTVSMPITEVDEFRIDYFSFMPEINRQNNNYRLQKAFKKAEPLNIKLIGALDDPQKIQGFICPVPGFNYYNGFMLGLAAYNHFLFQKKLEFDVLPFYGFRNNSIAGYGKIQLNFNPNGNLLQSINLGAKMQKFTYTDQPFDHQYYKLAPFINFEFKNKNPRSKISNRINYRFVFINKEVPYYTISQNDIIAEKKNLIYSVHDFHYIFSNKNILSPYSIDVNHQLSDDGMQKSSITFTYSKLFQRKTRKGSDKKSKLELRLFAGKMFNNSKNVNYLFRMSGQTGYQDYLFDYSYMGRSARSPELGFQQFTETDGAFKTWSPVGQSDNYLISLNVKSPKLFILPCYIFADMGMFHTSGLKSSNETLYSFGIGVPIIKNYVEVFLPLINSSNINDAQKANNLSWAETIRFTCNLNLANPFNLIKNNISL